MHLTMTVMMAARRYLMAEGEASVHQHGAKPGPPAFVVTAQSELNARLTTCSRTTATSCR